jgi:hypothetical protein
MSCQSCNNTWCRVCLVSPCPTDHKQQCPHADLSQLVQSVRGLDKLLTEASKMKVRVDSVDQKVRLQRLGTSGRVLSTVHLVGSENPQWLNKD